jgi:Transposase DDE domain
MRSGSACKVISLPCPNVADRQFTRCGPFSMRSSTCCAPAAHGAISPPTFHRGRPSSTISGVCASKGPGRSCYGRCTALDANDKEGILTQVPKAGDSQSVKTVEEASGICGYDAHKHIKGRKRHILVDTLGVPISIYVTPADTHDTRGARCLLAGLKFFVPRLCKDLGRCGLSRAGVS